MSHAMLATRRLEGHANQLFYGSIFSTSTDYHSMVLSCLNNIHYHCAIGGKEMICKEI